MERLYHLWVDLPHKRISLVEVAGFRCFAYESPEALARVVKLLSADGYQLQAA